MKRILVSILALSIAGTMAAYKATATENEVVLREDFEPISILEMNGYFDEEVEVEEIEEEKEWLRDIPLSEELQEYTWNLANEYELSYDLVLGVMMTESSFRPNLVSSTSDYGLCQINRVNIPRLKKTLGITDILDPKQNILAGVYMLDEARHNWIDEGITSQEELFNRMLLAYNRGFGGSKSYIRRNGTSENVYTDKVLKYKMQIEQGGI